MIRSRQYHHRDHNHRRVSDLTMMSRLSNFLIVLLLMTLPTVALSRESSESSSRINFCVIGDWGGREWFPYFTYAQYETAKGMAKIADDINSQFVLALGDNFYYHGLTNDHSYRFQRTFEDVYNQDSLTKIPWYAIGGNHDHYGNITDNTATSCKAMYKHVQLHT